MKKSYLLLLFSFLCVYTAMAQESKLVGTWKGTSSNKEDPCVFIVNIGHENDSLRIVVGRIESDKTYGEWGKCHIMHSNEKSIYFYRDIISDFTGEKHNGKELRHLESRLYHNVKLEDNFLYLNCTRIVMKWYDIYGDLIDEKKFDFDDTSPDILYKEDHNTN